MFSCNLKMGLNGLISEVKLPRCYKLLPKITRSDYVVLPSHMHVADPVTPSLRRGLASSFKPVYPFTYTTTLQNNNTIITSLVLEYLLNTRASQ